MSIKLRVKRGTHRRREGRGVVTGLGISVGERLVEGREEASGGGGRSGGGSKSVMTPRILFEEYCIA
jgi:hypothetical protein